MLTAGCRLSSSCMTITAPRQRRREGRQVASSDAIVVLGPDISIMCLAAGPLYTEAGLASVTPTANSDRVTTNATTFQTVISTSAMAASLANYLHHVIGGSRAVVIFKNDGYGQSFKTGFQQAAERLGIYVTYRSYGKPEDAQEVARELAGDATKSRRDSWNDRQRRRPRLGRVQTSGHQRHGSGTSPMANDFFASSSLTSPSSVVIRASSRMGSTPCRLRSPTAPTPKR